VTVRRLAASWSDLLREAHGLVHGAHKGPMAASGERQ
jgi:hypothetical protein